MTYDAFDVVVTPFPFADRDSAKKRPAVVVSRHHGFGEDTGVAIIAMITTGRASQWPLDVPVRDLASAGLEHGCVMRMKLATLDYGRIERRIGRLGETDRAALAGALRCVLPMAGG